MNCRFSLGLVSLAVGTVFLLACCTPQPAAIPLPLPTPKPRPDFIAWVTPEESSLVPQSVYDFEDEEIHQFGRPDPKLGYASTVCVSPNLGSLVEKGDVFENSDDVFERIELEVDGKRRKPARSLDGLVLTKQLDDDGNVVAEWGGPYSLCWLAPVNEGIHDVTFRFRQTSDTIREYMWQFATSDIVPTPVPTATPVIIPAPLEAVFPLPTPEPQPNFIFEIAPLPATSISIEEFNHEVCVGIDRKLLFGDAPYDDDYFFEHFTTTLNGTPVEGAQIPPEKAFTRDAIKVTIRDETKITIGEKGPHPLTRCWLRVELEPGMYQMTIAFEKPSGEVVAYDSFFVITQE